MLESSRIDMENHRSFLFLNPERILAIHRLDELPSLFSEIERSISAGCFVAGFFSYECGYYFEKFDGAVTLHDSVPLAWFGVYRKPYVFDHQLGRFTGEAPPAGVGEDSSSSMKNCDLRISDRDYRSSISLIKDYIAAGDTYQVNFTSKYAFEFEGSPANCYTELRRKQKVACGAFINAGGKFVLSFSPELFFSLKEERLLTQPMKGTARRGRYATEDDAIKQWLSNDEKNRSENLMIVDLLRNDVGRIAEVGSVVAKDMFAVEKFETLFQMTSKVEGIVPRNLPFYDIIRSLFPSGSVTGAPKIRTMKIILELEKSPRGIYTGAIGYFSPRREAAFNIAIRTLVIEGSRGEMGVGSGIVFDSDPQQEFEECKLKAHFLTQPANEFHLIESIFWGGTYRFLSSHLARIRSSAEYFGFVIDVEKIAARLKENVAQLDPRNVFKVRVLMSREGEISIENQAVVSTSSTGKIVLSSRKTSSKDRFLYHKTSRREMYDEELAAALRNGFDEVIFRNENGELTEGSISNLFIEDGGRLYTPPLTCGLLPGIYRQHLLAHTPGSAEKVLSVEDLRNADAIYICNAIRGMRRVELVGT